MSSMHKQTVRNQTIGVLRSHRGVSRGFSLAKRRMSNGFQNTPMASASSEAQEPNTETRNTANKRRKIAGRVAFSRPPWRSVKSNRFLLWIRFPTSDVGSDELRFDLAADILRSLGRSKSKLETVSFQRVKDNAVVKHETSQPSISDLEKFEARIWQQQWTREIAYLEIRAVGPAGLKQWRSGSRPKADLAVRWEDASREVEESLLQAARSSGVKHSPHAVNSVGTTRCAKHESVLQLRFGLNCFVEGSPHHWKDMARRLGNKIAGRGLGFSNVLRVTKSRADLPHQEAQISANAVLTIRADAEFTPCLEHITKARPFTWTREWLFGQPDYQSSPSADAAAILQHRLSPTKRPRTTPKGLPT